MNAPFAELTTYEATSYTELISAIKQQVGRLGIKYEDFDTLCDFAPGLSGKVFGPAQVKRLGPEKLFDALRGAGLRLRVEIDPEQEARMKARVLANFLPRQANQARPNNHASPVSSALMGRVFKHFSREGNKVRWRNIPKKARADHAKKMANARWIKERKRRRAAHAKRQRERGPVSGN